MPSMRLMLCVLCCVTTFGWAPGALAQEGEFNLQAALRAGSCDDRGDRIARLEDPELPRGNEEGAPDGLSALFSETTIDVPIEDLLDDDTILAITREGESGVDACGAVGGLLSRQDVLTIQVTEVGESGVWGIAILIPNDDEPDQTDVTLYLGGDGLEGAPEPEPTAERPDNDDPDNGGDEDNGQAGATETYESPQFGYTLTYDPEVWTVADEPVSSPEDGDTFSLEAGFTTVYFSGVSAPIGAQQCIEILADAETSSESVLDFEPLVDDNGEAIAGGDDSDAFVAYRLLREGSDGEEIGQAFYVRCIVLVPGESVLAIYQYVADSLYVLAEVLRDGLLEGLKLP